MFVKGRLAPIIGVALICLTTAAVSQPAADPYADVLNEPATNEAINHAQGKLSANGCADKDCLAFKDIAHAIDVLFRLHHPNSLARTRPLVGDSYAKANKELRQTLLAHPERKNQYCAILTKLAGRFDPTYHEVGYDVIEIASRISTKAFPCISTVLQAFPETPEVMELIKGSREDCIENRRAGCSLIARRK